MILAASILTFLSFFIHTFMGDKELKLLAPKHEVDQNYIKAEKWTMARCGWHWVSFDLLFASIGLFLINFTDYFVHEKTLLQILSIYFFGYSFVSAFTLFISPSFPKNYLKLGQWMLLLVIAVLIILGL